MGKGDARTRKGKIFKGSYGNSRPRKGKSAGKTVARPVTAKTPSRKSA
jgi:30S ribosomal protein S31